MPLTDRNEFGQAICQFLRDGIFIAHLSAISLGMLETPNRDTTEKEVSGSYGLSPGAKLSARVRGMESG